MEAGKLELEQIEFDLHSLAMQTLSIFKGQVAQKSLELLCDIGPEVPRQWRGDPTRLRQIMLNLLSNAVKFTPQGAVTLSLSCCQAGLMLRVSDTGPGLSDQQQRRLFQAFSQGGAEVARTHGGSGLGLSICRSLVELMGGRIGVESRLGTGASFWAEVPLLALGQATQPIAGLAGLRWLLVDASEALGGFVSRCATHWGMEVVQVTDAEQALQKLQEARTEGRPFSLMSVDFSQGLSLVQRVRETTVGEPLAIIILAQVSLLPDFVSPEELGVNEVLEKPVSPDELQHACARALGLLAPAVMAPLEDAPQQDAAMLRILVAEDNPVNQQVIMGMLARLGHRSCIAVNGAEALRRVQQEPFDLIFMDCDMPELDGWQAARAIRAWEHEQQRSPIPIIALSGHALPEHREACLEAGMQDQLAKPVSLAVLRPMLATWGRGEGGARH